MENLAFKLDLFGNSASEAKKTAAALGKVESSAKKAQTALDFSKDIDRTHQSLKKLEGDPGGYIKMLKAQKELSEQRKKLAKQAGINKESFGEALGKKFSVTTIGAAAMAGEILGEGALKIGESLIEGAHKVVEIFTEGFKKALEEGGKLETLRLGYKLSLGEKGGKEALEDVNRFSKLTGFDDDRIAGMLLPLRRAGFSQDQARTRFAAAADIEAGGGMKAEEALDSFTNLKLKGGVTAKQLVGMGVNAPEFYKKLGKALGVSKDEAEKRAGEGGKVSDELLFNIIAEGIEKRQGGKLGTGAIEASKTLEKRLEKIKNLPNEYLKTVADSPAFKKLSDRFGEVLEKLDPEGPTGQRIVGKLQSMFGTIVDYIDDLVSGDGMDKLADGIDTFVGVLKTAVDWVAKLARFMERVIDLAGKASAPLAKVMEFSDHLTGQDQHQQSTFEQQLREKFLRGELTADQIGPAVAKFGGGGNVQVHAPVTIVAAPGEDPAVTHAKAGEHIGRHIDRHAERIAQEAGGQ